MKSRILEDAQPSILPASARGRFKALLGAALLLAGGGGCGPVDEAPEAPRLGSQPQAVLSDNGLASNGLAFNGLAFNGLAFNGLAFNGLAFNGLAFNGLNSAEFASWFQMDPDQTGLVMKYIVQCAVPAGEHRTHWDGNRAHSWEGLLGLAPGWASGAAATVDEQRLISACLAAHANKFGVQVPISVLGRDAAGTAIPYTAEELKEQHVREACFFGNFFTGEGLYVGNDRGLMEGKESTARACALSSSDKGASSACPPLIYIGACDKRCEPDPSALYYLTCTYKGKTYPAITTRLRKEEVYKCGDGICQISESCGTGHQYDNCGLDCGACR